MPRWFYAAAVLSIGAVTFFGAFHYTTATNTVTPQDADVNKDGAVTIADALSVLPQIGQLAPTPAPPTTYTVVAGFATGWPSCTFPTYCTAKAFCDPGD